MDWVLVGFVIFKVGVFGTGMFFSIKSHHDRAMEQKRKAEEQKARAETVSSASKPPV